VFITQSLLSPRVKKKKISQHLPKLWAIKCRVVFFYETPCTETDGQSDNDRQCTIHFPYVGGKENIKTTTTYTVTGN